MSQTISARLPKELNKQLREKCEELGCTVNDYIKETIESKLTGSKSEGILSDSINYEEVFEHMKNCPSCDKAMISKGYLLVSLEELKKYNLVPAKSPVEKYLNSL